MTHITTIKINSKASCNLLQTRHSFTPWFVKNAKQTCTFFVPCLVFCLCWVVFLTQKLHLSVHLKHCRTGCPLKRQSQQQSCFTNCMCQDTLERKSIFFRICVSSTQLRYWQLCGTEGAQNTSQTLVNLFCLCYQNKYPVQV